MAYKANDLRKMLTEIIGDAKTMRAKAHNYLVYSLDHYRETGNLAPFADFANRTQKTGLNRRAALQWIQRYARATLVILNGKVKFTKKPGADHKTVDVDKANSLPFYDDDSLDGRTGDDLKSFNLMGRVRSAIKKQKEIAAAVADNDGDMRKAGYDPDKTVIYDQDVLDKLESFVETYGNLDKPQTKADKPLFKGSHVQTADEPTLKQVG